MKKIPSTRSLSVETALDLFREYRANQKKLSRGTVEQEKLKRDVEGMLGSLVLMLVVVGIFFAILFGTIIAPSLGGHYSMPYLAQLLDVPQYTFTASIFYGIQFTLILGWLILLYPFAGILLLMSFTLKLPSRENWDKNRFFIKGLHLLAGGFALVSLFDHDFLMNLTPWVKVDPNINAMVFLLWSIILGCVLALAMVCLPHDEESRKKPIKERFLDMLREESSKKEPFSLYLGETTGSFIDRKHVAGLKKHQKVFLSEKDSALNVLILGGIGEGKTTNAINTLLLQLLDQDCGGLIFDVKGSFHHTVNTFAKATQKSVVTIGTGKQKINLMAGLKPEIASDLITSIFYMTNGNNKENYWITQASNLCRGAFGLLSFLPLHYSLEGLRKYIFDNAFREDIDLNLSKLELSDENTALLLSYRQSLGMFYDCNERMQSDIKAAASSALSQFTLPSVVESFCYTQNPKPLQLEDVLKGTIFLVDMPKSEYGQLSRVIHALIKMRWFHVMESRRRHSEWDQNRMVFFMCDEYQSLITASSSEGTVSDLSFWDKSRDTKTIGIISAQSISSFYSAIGDRDLANTVLQNFRQRLCFKTEDEVTIEHLRKIAGEVSVAQKSQSVQEGRSQGSNNNSNSSYSSSESLSHIRQSVIDGQLMRTLEPNQAIALLNLDQRSMDDILNLQPIYLN